MNYAGFWRRLTAVGVDLALILMLLLLVYTVIIIASNQTISTVKEGVVYAVDCFKYSLLAIYWLWLGIFKGFAALNEIYQQLTIGMEDNHLPTLIELAQGYATILTIYVIYATFLESSPKQASIGGMVTGIKVVNLYGKRLSFFRLLARNIIKILSIPLLGMVWMLFLRRKQTLYDRISGCVLTVSPGKHSHFYEH